MNSTLNTGTAGDTAKEQGEGSLWMKITKRNLIKYQGGGLSSMEGILTKLDKQDPW